MAREKDCRANDPTPGCIDLTAKELSAILKASFGGTLTLKERQELGFLVLRAEGKLPK